MPVVLDLPPEVEAGLVARAAAIDTDLGDYIVRFLAASVAGPKELTPDKRAALITLFAGRHPNVPILADEDIGR